uniref:DNA-directed DNA polymerase n=1 Tax=Macrostomum lignano TaxID=282301 RepID=A0A1I8GA83_9PLAT
NDNMLKAAHTPPVRASRMTAELLFKHIDKIVQSDATVLTSNISIRLLKAWVPRRGCSLENKHLEERHAFSRHYDRITNMNKRCLLRALVVACAYLQFVAKTITKRLWQTIKANSPTQTKLVAELKIDAGLYTTLQTVSQAGPFGVNVLPEAIRALNRLHPGHDFGVRVYRAKKANRCIYELPGTEILHLHLVEQHYNVITKLPAFFGSMHYCSKCEMTYDFTNAKYKCVDACSTCKTPGSNCKANRAYNSRLMYMKSDKIVFKDSLSFIPIGLAQFPKALDLGTQLTKGDFPHVFNQPQNWGYVGPYCSIEMYGGKKNKQHDSIADWLAKQEGRVFNFNGEYLDFCLQGTLILREGCLKYTRLIKDICGLDAFVQSNTIAGLAMAVFTTKFMEPNTLGPPIRLEEALFGGRTEAFVPHAEATETVELRYRDVVSLYLTVNKFDKYPVGHPVHHPEPHLLDEQQL